MIATYDPDGDILYVSLSDAPVDHTENVSGRPQYERGIDYSADGAVVGYEFMNASQGISLDDLPHQVELRALLLRTQQLQVRQSG